MKQLALILILTMTCIALQAQDTQNMAVVTEQEAQYPEGQEALIKFVYNSIRFSDEACAKELNTEAEISFDVMPDSTLSNIVFIHKVGYGVDEEILRIMKTIKFQPAILMGVKVRRNVFQTIPILTNKMMLLDSSRQKTNQNAAKPKPAAPSSNDIQNNDED